MPTKRIQLRGISRLPSDRKTTDGGLSVSLNAQVRNEESEPMVTPLDVTGRLGSGDHYIPEFVHRMASVDNILMLDYARKKLYYARDKGDVLFYVNLVSAGANKLNVITAIKEVTGMGTKQVKSIVDNAPVQEAFAFDNLADATELRDAINTAGGTANIDNTTTLSSGDTLIHDFGNEAVLDIQSMGNTIVVRTEKHMHYILWKDGSYKYLGTKIPEALVKVDVAIQDAIEVTKRWVDIDDRGLMDSDFVLLSTGIMSAAREVPAQIEIINKIFAQDGVLVTKKYLSGNESEIAATSYIDTLASGIWRAVMEIISQQRALGVFCFPVMLRHSTILSDGTHIHQSCPQLIGAEDFNQSIRVELISTGIKVTMLCPYKLSYKVKMDGLDNWSDIIRSVRIGLSTDICNPLMHARPNKAEAYAYSGVSSVSLLFKEQTGYNQPGDMEKEVLSKTIFYEVESRDTETITSTYGDSTDIKPLAQDELVVKNEIPDDELSHHERVSYGEVQNYNGKLIYPGSLLYPYNGHPFLTCELVDAQLGFAYRYSSITIDYYLYDADGAVRKVTAVNDTGSTSFTGKIGSWLYYPDPRCRKAVITADTGREYNIEMKEHPGLNGAYAIAGMGGTSLLSKAWRSRESITPVPVTVPDPIYEKNKVCMTKTLNPFYYPVETRYQFQDDIVKVVPTTLALSQNQYMADELYVFTSGGIWTMKLADTGNAAVTRSLSREVVTTPDAVTAIEKGVVFVTAAAVCIIQEGQVSDITPYMNGKHYTLSGNNDLKGDNTDNDHTCAELIAGKEKYGDTAVELLQDDTPFMEFMAGSQCSYDYRGKRLLFFNEKYRYQYVFTLDSNTWHTMSVELSALSGLWFVKALNSYPDALVSMRSATKGKLIDASTLLETRPEDTTTLPSVFITRPFNLEEPDILKSITDVRIRGQFNRSQNRVSFMLQGSQDGIRFYRVRSLRGKSWKMFRIILLADLKADERITYIEVEYESRFGNRMR